MTVFSSEGRQLDKYHLYRLLGKGTFGDVYLGKHLYLGTQAAIKVLHSALPLLEHSLEIAFQDGNQWVIARYLDLLAAVAIGQDNAIWAACLGGAAEMLRETIGTPIPATEREAQKQMCEDALTM